MEETTGNITYKVDDNYLASRKLFSEFLTKYKADLEADNWQKILSATRSKILYTILHLGHIDPLKYIKGALPHASFSVCLFITSVNIPDSITSLGESCFSYCISLESVTLPDSVISLGEFCFENCTSLESITLPDSIISLGISCFYRCSSLKTLTCSKDLKFDREKIGLADNVQIIRK